MNQRHKESRRTFLKTSLIGAAGIAAANPFEKSLWTARGTWTDKMPINPDIDNLRVVYCTDSSMVTGTTVSWDYDNQNKNISTTKVSENMDKMAIALAQKTTAAEAWTTIFRKPSSKAWADVKVAIKVNTQAANCMPRYAVVVKVCDALINNCGVTPSNICIYSCKNITHVANLTKVEDCYGLAANQTKYPFPAGVKIQSNLFSGNYSATVSVSGGAAASVACLNDLADGTVDILVNIAANKGHYQAGAVTLCQKNHIGTIKFFCPGQTVAGQSQGVYTPGSCTDLIALNKTDAIVGGDPVRQQLCIVDSIYAMKSGPVGSPDKQLNTLVMGTLAGAVDYLTYWKVRVPASYPSSYESDINSFITGYGYSTTERDNLKNLAPENNGGKGWVNALAPVGISGEGDNYTTAKQRDIIVSLHGKKIAHVSFPASEPITRAKIVNLQGRVLKDIALPKSLTSSIELSLGAAGEGGVPLGTGHYQLVIEGAHFRKYADFSYMRE